MTDSMHFNFKSEASEATASDISNKESNQEDPSNTDDLNLEPVPDPDDDLPF